MDGRVSKGLIIPLLFAFALMFSTAYGSVFYLNSTQVDVNDTYWNVEDEYSPYLSYLNPYHEDFCDDLRTCYIDDTNTGDVDSNIVWIRTNILGKSLSGINYPVLDGGVTPQKVGDKFVDGGQYYFFRVYNDTIAGDYDILIQRGTITEYYDDAELIYQFSENGVNPSATCGSPSYITQNQADFYFQLERCGLSVGVYNSILVFKTGDGDIILTARTGTYSTNGFAHSQYGSVVSVYPHNKLGELGHYTLYFDQYAWHGVSGIKSHSFTYEGLVGTNLTDFTGYTSDIYKSDSYSSLFSGTYNFNPDKWDLLITSPSTYLGTKYKNEMGSDGRSNLVFFPKLINDGSYKSVELPLCSDIYISDTQNDITYSSGTWSRECSGIVPSGETYSCERSCIELDSDYDTLSGTCRSVPILDSFSDATGDCQILEQFSYPYIIPETNHTRDVSEFGFDYVTIDDVNYTATMPTYALIDYLKIQFSGGYNSTADGIWVKPKLVSGVGYSQGTNDILVGGINPCLSVNYGDVGVVYAQFSADDYNPYSTNYPIISDMAYYLNYISAFANSYYEVKAYPTYADCIAETNALANSNLTDKYMEIDYEYRYVTDYGTSCAEYDICYPDVPSNETYDEEDVICVGLYCFVDAVPICNLNGVCDDGETNALCPDDCPIATISETADTVATWIELFIGFVATALGISETLAMGVIWMVLTIIVGGVIFAVSGVMVGAVATYVLMMLVGTMIGWMPLWIGIVFVVLTGFVLAKTVSDFVRGG